MFLLGHWKNYEELENNLSLEELQATLNAIRDKEKREREFLAGINGIDLTETLQSKPESNEDISSLNSPYKAKEDGFGVNEGLGFMFLEG